MARDRATAYARDVVAGREVAGPLVRLACQRHLDDVKRGRDRGLRWSVAEAQHGIDFFEEVLHLPEVAPGEPPTPFLLHPSQDFLVGSLFGWLTVDDVRRFRVAYIEEGKGNGKSPLAAGIGLKCFVADGEASPEVYTAATMRDQARICWNDARLMVEASPWLLDRHIKVRENALLAPASAGVFKPVSSEARGLEGKRVHCAILDEVHEHPNGDVVSKMRAGTKGRPNPLIVEITNSGHDRLSICWEHHEYSSKILRGVIQADHWFAYICGLDEGDDWHDPTVWKKANPLLGTGRPPSAADRAAHPYRRTTIEPKYLAERIAEADGIPSEEAKVQRLNFCIWTKGKVQWMPFEQWQACGALVPDDELRGVPCFGGIDLGQSDDFSAAVLVWPRPTDWVVRAWCWIPEAVQETKPDRPYDDWVTRGELIVHPGEVTDLDRLEDDLVRIWAPYQVVEVGYDRRHASQLALRMANEHEYPMIDTPQGYFLSEAIGEIERRVKSVTLAHGHNAVLGWMFDNVILRSNRDGLKKIDRGAVREKVDGMVALANAVDRIIRQGKPEAASILETRGPRHL